MTSRFRALWRAPVGGVLAVALVLRVTGLFWGMPASDGWDDDGVAPRDFLPGVLLTYWPGHHYTYPPLQLIILTLASAPVWIAKLLGPPSFEQEALVRTFIQVPTMTALTVIARATTAAMSLGLLWNVAKVGEDLGGSRRAGAWAAATCGANAVFTYYSQTSNLDVPYLFWAVLALRTLVRSIVHRDLVRLGRVPVFAALAVTTKDQAYALFVLGIPMASAAWLLVDGKARPRVSEIVTRLASGSTVAVGLLLVVDGAIWNWTGFAARMKFLLGAASQDHANYAKTWEGRGHALRNSLLVFHEYYPWIFAPLVLLGIFVALRTPDGAKRTAGLVPLFFGVSFTIAFNMAARRTEHRFVLPQMLMWGIYAGLAFDALHTQFERTRPWAPWVVAVPCFAAALFRCAAVDVAMVFDPRYDAERWMGAHVRPGDRVEVYGNDVHLPRLSFLRAVERVEPTPAEGRNPLPGVTEVSDRFSDVEARRPRFIVVPAFWAHRYLVDRGATEHEGRVLTPEESNLEADVDSRGYFQALRAGRLEYRLAHLSTWESRIWPRIDIHASLTRDVWIFERKDSALPRE
jgi:hypothetical protein